MEITPDELQQVREYRNRVQREWWSRKTPEERRERRQRYALNAARKLAERERSEKYSLMKRKRGNEK